MNENDEIQTAESVMPEQLPESAALQAQNYYLKVIIAILVLFFGLLVTFFFVFSAGYFKNDTAEKNTDLPIVLETKIPQVEDSVNSEVGDIKETSSQLSLYQDPYIKDFKVMYDADLWEVSSTNLNEVVTVSFKNKLEDGILEISVHPRWGVGGALHAFTSEEIYLVDPATRLYRFADTNQDQGVAYRYGFSVEGYNSNNFLQKTAVWFDQDLEKKTNAVKNCQEVQADKPVFPFFSKEKDCDKVLSGAAIGYIESPIFYWSLGPYTDGKSLDATAVAEATFKGTKVSEADEIVKQLKKFDKIITF